MFNIDQYSDVTCITKPIIYISISEIVEIHKVCLCVPLLVLNVFIIVILLLVRLRQIRHDHFFVCESQLDSEEFERLLEKNWEIHMVVNGINKVTVALECQGLQSPKICL